MISTWTADREAEAVRLWRDGHSAAHIARVLGGITRVAVMGKIHRLGLSRETRSERSSWAQARPKAKAVERSVCAVPGCGVVLSSRNKSAVCQTHYHASGHCRCPGCAGRAVPVAVRAPRTVRPDVRVAEVPYATSNSGVNLRASVSVKREPWLKEGTP